MPRRELHFFVPGGISAGSFSCSDPKLNELWNSSRWLTQICMQTHHLDSPNHQEPICDPGDYLIESHANYYAFGSPWLARQDLRKFGIDAEGFELSQLPHKLLTALACRC